MTGFEDGKLIRIKGEVIPRKQDFVVVVDSEKYLIRYGMFEMDIRILIVFPNFKNMGWLKGFPPLKDRCKMRSLYLWETKFVRIHYNILERKHMFATHPQ